MLRLLKTSITPIPGTTSRRLELPSLLAGQREQHPLEIAIPEPSACHLVGDHRPVYFQNKVTVPMALP